MGTVCGGDGIVRVDVAKPTCTCNQHFCGNWYGTDDRSAEDLNDNDFYPYHLQRAQSLLAGRLRHPCDSM